MELIELGENLVVDKSKYSKAVKELNKFLKDYGLSKTNLHSSIFRYAKIKYGILLNGKSELEYQIWFVNKFQITKRTEVKIQKHKFVSNFTPPSRKLEYWEFLQTSYWFGIKDLVLRRDKHKCIACGSKKSLQVHHKVYTHRFSEHKHLDDLETLCGDCHKFVHSIDEKQMIEQHLNSI
jgi:hypothetical protein